MKKITLLAFVISALYACQNPSANVANLSTLGREEYGYLTTTYYNYTSLGQLKTIEKVEEDYTSDISLEYLSSGEVLIKSCEYGMSEEVYTLEFNAKGFVCKAKLEAGEFSEGEYITFEYDGDDQLVKSVKYSQSGSEISRKECLWQDGNLVEVRSSKPIIISYSSLINKPVNYDLIYFSVLDPKLGALCPSQFFGRMSKNLPDQIEQGDSQTRISYTLDTKGYVSVATLESEGNIVRYVYAF